MQQKHTTLITIITDAHTLCNQERDDWDRASSTKQDIFNAKNKRHRTALCLVLFPLSVTQGVTVKLHLVSKQFKAVLITALLAACAL